MARNKKTFSWKLSETSSRKWKVIHLKGAMVYNAWICIYIGSYFHLVGMITRAGTMLCYCAWEVTGWLFVGTCMIYLLPALPVPAKPIHPEVIYAKHMKCVGGEKFIWPNRFVSCLFVMDYQTTTHSSHWEFESSQWVCDMSRQVQQGKT